MNQESTRYHLQVFDSSGYNLIQNFTNFSTPLFSISNLTPATTYFLTLWAGTTFGGAKSTEFNLTTSTKAVHDISIHAPLRDTRNYIIKIILPISASILVLLIIAIIFLWIRVRPKWIQGRKGKRKIAEAGEKKDTKMMESALHEIKVDPFLLLSNGDISKNRINFNCNQLGMKMYSSYDDESFNSTTFSNSCSTTETVVS